MKSEQVNEILQVYTKQRRQSRTLVPGTVFHIGHGQEESGSVLHSLTPETQLTLKNHGSLNFDIFDFRN
jgi:hypothetical protein